MMAVLAGAGGPTAIARWAVLKEELLLRLLKLPNGIPRKDVFRRVLSLLKPDVFHTCFVNWLESLRAKAAKATAKGSVKASRTTGKAGTAAGKVKALLPVG